MTRDVKNKREINNRETKYRSFIKRSFIKRITAATFGFLLLVGINTSLGQVSSDSLTYTVKKNDFLSKIGVEYGSPNFWLPIYKANKHKIADPNLIYPGQVIIIPKTVTASERYIGNRKELTKEETEKKSGENKKMLDAFRKAFTNTIEEEQKSDTQISPSVDNGLEFGGLIINETESKIGKDFFHVFYQYWEDPQNAPNFLLTITEQMLPSMGTIISVNLDHRPVFKIRLQPRMEIVEQNAKRAVAFSYRALQQKLQTSNALTTY